MISTKVYLELISVRRVQRYLPVSPATETGWTAHERELFWTALDRCPRGPWAAIADLIGTKSSRQVMTHSQKLRQKLKRWVTRLRRNPNALSLMDGVATPTPADISSIPQRSLTTVISASEVAPRLSNHAPTQSEVSSRPAQCAGEDRTDHLGSSLCLHLHEGCISAHPWSDPVFSSEQEDGTPNRALQLLFEPQADTSSRSMSAATGSSYSTASVPYPTNESSMSARLLNELADELWGYQLGEGK